MLLSRVNKKIDKSLMGKVSHNEFENVIIRSAALSG